MPTTFANTIDGNDIYAKRAECDAAGNTLSTTYATKGELPTVDQTYDGTSTNPQSGAAIAGALASYTPTASLATVATTGDFDDLTSKPTVKPLVAGSNITITENANDITIAAAGGGGGSYTAGTGIDITSDVISVDTSVVATQTDLAGLKQVPAVTSNDNAKVLTANYSGGTGSYSWQKPVFVAIYGTTTYQAVMDAISAGSLVFCQVGNTETTYRRAVLSYVDSGLGKVEFLYYRSVGTHSASQQGDQAIIYMVDSTNAWTTTTREAYTAIAAGTHMSQSYNNGTLTLNATWPTVDQTYSAASTNAQSGTAVAGAIAGVEQVPTVTSSDNNKVLKASYSGGVGSYSWQTESGGGGGGDGADWAAEQGEPGYIENKPVPKTLTGGTGISITESASTITVSCNVTAPVQDVTVDGTSVVSNGVAAITSPTVDQTYDGTSTNAQSGVAVAEGLASKQDTLTAGTGISISNSNVISADRTVLWEVSSTPPSGDTQITLSFNYNETVANFEFVDVYWIGDHNNTQVTRCYVDSGQFFFGTRWPENSYSGNWFMMSISGNGTTGSRNGGFKAAGSIGAYSSYTGGMWGAGTIWKVVGCHRIASN